MSRRAKPIYCLARARVCAGQYSLGKIHHTPAATALYLPGLRWVGDRGIGGGRRRIIASSTTSSLIIDLCRRYSDFCPVPFCSSFCCRFCGGINEKSQRVKCQMFVPRDFGESRSSEGRVASSAREIAHASLYFIYFALGSRMGRDGVPFTGCANRGTVAVFLSSFLESLVERRYFIASSLNCDGLAYTGIMERAIFTRLSVIRSFRRDEDKYYRYRKGETTK